MFQILFLVFAVSLCQADPPVTTPPPVRCGYMPSLISNCIGNPQIIKVEDAAKCATYVDCERTNCFFREFNWLDGDKIDKPKVSAHLDQYAKDNPSWAPAIQIAKTYCLGKDLPAQGAFLNCPSFDILTCTLAAFIKNAQPSQWSQSAQCAYPRQYAAACPVCPDDCFVPQVPYGSCNACLLLPRSP